ncbi:MAG: proteasome-type protease [Oculatellaceae cyanobacterium bins.114]|nr:proteasome-type protease [Oculatellaceae cyanobacterium bins.114]
MLNPSHRQRPMTYCLGIITQYGLVIAADSRTNAGVDYISTYQKLFDFSKPGDRIIFITTSGNLSITQSMLNALRCDLKLNEADNLHSLSRFYDIARYVGSKIRQIQEQDRPWLEREGIDFSCNCIVGGQIKGEDPELYLVYSQGNCIQATPDTPFLQIGETKYGKPILDRTLTFETSLEDAAKCAILSIDSTMKSNISVGPPISLVMYEAHSFKIKHQLRLRIGDPYLAEIRKVWEKCLKHAFDEMPNLNWEHIQDPTTDDIFTD